MRPAACGSERCRRAGPRWTDDYRSSDDTPRFPLWRLEAPCYNSRDFPGVKQETLLANQRLRDYEIVMVLSPEVTEDEASATVETVSAFIGERGGTVNHQENWGVRRLAYPIQKFGEGNYFLSRFTLDAENIVELDRSLNASQSVLRHLVIKMDKTALAAVEKKLADDARRAAEAQARAERDAREAEERAEREAEEKAGAQAEEEPAEPQEAVAELDREQPEAQVAEVSEPDTEEAEAEAEAKTKAKATPAKPKAEAKAKEQAAA